MNLAAGAKRKRELSLEMQEREKKKEKKGKRDKVHTRLHDIDKWENFRFSNFLIFS